MLSLYRRSVWDVYYFSRWKHDINHIHTLEGSLSLNYDESHSSGKSRGPYPSNTVAAVSHGAHIQRLWEDRQIRLAHAPLFPIHRRRSQLNLWLHPQWIYVSWNHTEFYLEFEKTHWIFLAYSGPWWCWVGGRRTRQQAELGGFGTRRVKGGTP